MYHHVIIFRWWVVLLASNEFVASRMSFVSFVRQLGAWPNVILSVHLRTGQPTLVNWSTPASFHERSRVLATVASLRHSLCLLHLLILFFGYSVVYWAPWEMHCNNLEPGLGLRLGLVLWLGLELEQVGWWTLPYSLLAPSSLHSSHFFTRARMQTHTRLFFLPPWRPSSTWTWSFSLSDCVH